jgi:four helix bundle protein
MDHAEGYDLEERLITFAVRATEVARALVRDVAGKHVANHLMRSSTSAAFHYGEAQSAESAADFVHKMKVCLKELREARICLVLAQRAKLISPPERLDALIDESRQLILIFHASIATAEKKQQTPKRRKP